MPAGYRGAGFFPDLEEEDQASEEMPREEEGQMPYEPTPTQGYAMPDEEQGYPPTGYGRMPRADSEPEQYHTNADPRFRLPGAMPPAEDQLPQEPRGYAQAAPIPQEGFSRGGLGVPPLRMTDQGAFVADEQGNPLMSLKDYHGRMMGGQSRQKTMTPEQEAASFNSGLRWGPNTPEQTSQFGQMISQRQAHLQNLYQQVQNDPNLSALDKSHALSHLAAQSGQLAEHWEKAQQASKKQSATAAGLHPDYGTAQGPELDPRQREQLQDAEYAIQQIRSDPSLSTQQKVAAVSSLSNKINQIDPAGRYRNGQQPMSPVEKFQAQNVHVDTENGYVMAIDAKGQPHFHALPKPEKGGKDTGFDALTFQQQHKMVDDFARQYGISHQEAVQHIRQHEQLIRGGGGGGPELDPQPLRPLRDQEHEQRHMENVMKLAQAEQARQEKDAKAQNAVTEKKKKAEQDAEKDAEKHDMTLQTASRTHAEQSLKSRNSLRARKETTATNKVTPDELDPDEIEKEAAKEYQKRGGKGYYGSPLSHAETTRTLKEHLPEARRKAQEAGDTEALHYFDNMEKLANAYPNLKNASPLERGHWLLGKWKLAEYVPGVKRDFNLKAFDAVDPRGNE